jgi:hypothetical protein
MPGWLPLPVFISSFPSGCSQPAAELATEVVLDVAAQAKARMVKTPTATSTFFGCCQVRSAIQVKARSEPLAHCPAEP